MNTGALNRLHVHESNQTLAEKANRLAVEAGLAVSHNVSSCRIGPFDGYHRWVILDPTKGSEDHSIRSRACLDYTEARYSRYFKPSIRGERDALVWVIARIFNIAKEVK